MAITIKELLIKGKVNRKSSKDDNDSKLVEAYLKKFKKQIIEECKEQIKEELEREILR